MILLVGGEKGGAGKSCLAQNIAVYLQANGHEVLLVDCDPQATTADWAAERGNNPQVTPITCVKIDGDKAHLDISALAKKYKIVVVDSGGQDSKTLRSALLCATHVLMPFRPKRRDLNTLPKAEYMIGMAKAYNQNMQFSAVMTQCPTLPSQVQRIIDAKQACREFGFSVLNAITMNRNVYDDADENGLSVLECHDEKAKAEIEDIVREFLGV